jgi:uncharacterized tellurite resistance protein B-like protein
MSLFRRVLTLDASASSGQPADPSRPLCDPGLGLTPSVRRIADRLTSLPPARARWVAAFAYLLGRAANATLAVSPTETAAMAGILGDVAELDKATATLVVELAGTLAGDFGASEDFLAAREFKAISTLEDRERLLRACFLVMAADDEIDATESWLANRLAEELDVQRPDLNSIRDEFHEQLSGVRSIRELAKG